MQLGQVLISIISLAAGSSLWAVQASPDGIEVRKPKEGCTCPGTHVPSCPKDGLWCPPWWPCTFETVPVEAMPVYAIPLTMTASWFIPHSKLSNLGVVAVPGTPGGGGTRFTPLRFLGSLGGGGGDSVSGSSSGPLFGPEIDYPLPPEAVQWMPFECAIQIYARVLVGGMEIDGEDSSVQDYALGIRLAVPVWRPPDFTLSPYVSVGPAYLRTEFGHATGLDAAAGLRGDYRLSKSVTFVVQLELDTFTSSDFFSWGPAGTLGLTIGF